MPINTARLGGRKIGTSPERKDKLMDWITSWPSVIFGSVGLLACVIGLLTEQFRPEPKPRPKRLQPEDIRQRLKKKSADCAATQTTQSMEKHAVYTIAGGGENVNLL